MITAKNSKLTVIKYFFKGFAFNDTFTVTCKGWKDEGTNADREAYISPSDYTLGYQVDSITEN